jgi:hypothetical protein
MRLGVEKKQEHDSEKQNKQETVDEKAIQQTGY